MYAQNPLPDPKAEELLKEIDRLRYLIRLQLNTREEPDQTIEALLLRIPQQTNKTMLQPLQESLEELTRTTQALLKEEWDKVKTEAKGGKLPG